METSNKLKWQIADCLHCTQKLDTSGDNGISRHPVQSTGLLNCYAVRKMSEKTLLMAAMLLLSALVIGQTTQVDHELEKTRNAMMWSTTSSQSGHAIMKNASATSPASTARQI